MNKPETAWGPHFFYDQPENFPEQDTIARKAILLSAVLDMRTKDDLYNPTLREVRAMLAYMLAKSANIGEFTNYSHSHSWGTPTEEDRKETLGWLSWYASVTGLLHAQEISWLMHSFFGNVPSYINNIETSYPLTPRDQLNKVAVAWSQQKCTIGAFQGSFDNPTVTHLSNATSAYLWAQYHGIKLRLIWWFDNDDLIKRKGTERPRFDLEHRRASVEGLWQVPATAVSSAANIEDYTAYIDDYQLTNTKIIFVTDDETLPPERIATATRSNAQIVTLKSSPIDFHSSDHVWQI